jgi:hypothetical protein
MFARCDAAIAFRTAWLPEARFDFARAARDPTRVKKPRWPGMKHPPFNASVRRDRWTGGGRGSKNRLWPSTTRSGVNANSAVLMLFGNAPKVCRAY